MRVLFAGPEFPAARSHLAAAQSGIDMMDFDPASPVTAEVLVPLMARIDGPFLDSVEGLRLVQQWGAGLEGVDLAAANDRAIAVGNVTTEESGSAESVAEWCVLAALAQARNLDRLATTIREGSDWGGPIGRSLIDKRALIVGLGGIGRALARRLMAFGIEVVVVTAHPERSHAGRDDVHEVLPPSALRDALSAADFVFLCLPLDHTTRGLLGASELEVMKSGSCLINPGRGALIDEAALLGALDSGRNLTVALDVFWREPLPTDHPLLRHPAVLATPHIAGVTDHSYAAIAERVAAVLACLDRREPLSHCVNWAEIADRFYR